MSFHDVRFPASVSLGALGGPQRRTEIVALANGFEERNTPWAHGRRRYDAGLGMRSMADIEAVIAFFEARQGQLFGFRWKDWSDYRSCPADQPVSPVDQDLGQGDGARQVFALSKLYRSGPASYLREITKPVSGSVRVARDGQELTAGVDFTVSAESGEITFASPPSSGALLQAGFEFDVPVRFDSDRLDISVAGFEAGEIPSVPVIEIRV
ncbi:MAG: DUF2460 domain-containing protein [Mangrovicoccus sp.]|nr:DUF2460 domain-containing protein [Mangrovicoccus sp.]